MLIFVTRDALSKYDTNNSIGGKNASTIRWRINLRKHACKLRRLGRWICIYPSNPEERCRFKTSAQFKNTRKVVRTRRNLLEFLTTYRAKRGASGGPIKYAYWTCRTNCLTIFAKDLFLDRWIARPIWGYVFAPLIRPCISSNWPVGSPGHDNGFVAREFVISEIQQ